MTSKLSFISSKNCVYCDRLKEYYAFLAHALILDPETHFTNPAHMPLQP